ncbi:MAG TPA: dihydrolipoamide acetyltransferase family protein [Anaerolineales bacterium]|nr:dihydrolipoamide acetyltransferase family protein [Anaerolineales bacterium]
MAETITMPKLGFDMQEGTLVRWVRNEGEDISKGDVLAEIETDKATVEVESSASGVVRKLLVDPGAVVPIGAPIAIVGRADEKIEETKAVSAQPAAKKEVASQTPTKAVPSIQPAVTPSVGRVKASPLAKKLARDSKVDLSRIQGTGPAGRIVRKDIEAALSSVQPAAYGPRSTAIVSPEDEVIGSTKLRQAIARRMAESKTTVPHFYVSHEYRMDAAMSLRKQLNEYLPDNEKLSVNDFVVKAVALALREFPNLNASYADDQVIRHGAINVGVAVAVENGLLTVVSRNADQEPLRQISNDVKRMAAGAREGKVKPDDIEGSTFSISNLGMYDVENFIAIINPPETAILAVGSAKEVPVAENGEIKIGWRMKATISVDHRVSDGAEAARFMQALATYLEEPLRLLV